MSQSSGEDTEYNVRAALQYLQRERRTQQARCCGGHEVRTEVLVGDWILNSKEPRGKQKFEEPHKHGPGTLHAS